MCNMFVMIFLVILISIVRSKVYRDEEYLQPGFNISELPILRTFERPSAECEHVTETVRILRYDYSDTVTGNVVRDTLTVVEKIEVDVMESGDSITRIYHWINCLEQDDPRLIQHIRNNWLVKPSTQPYNLTGKGSNDWMADGQARMLDQRYFQQKRHGGFFIEAGAHDGESLSTTLDFEMNYSWSGLLVEPTNHYFDQLVQTRRKSWATSACLSTTTRPQTVNFREDPSKSMGASSFNGLEGSTQGITNSTEDDGLVRKQCLPLYSLLLALGNPTVDLLTLDIEGPEYQVLSNIPWDKVDIRSIAVETQYLGEVMSGTKDQLFNLLEGAGFTHLGSIARDDIFVKLEAGAISLPLSVGQLFSPHQPSRRCQYFRVDQHQLNNHCRLNYPMDYFQETDLADIPDCVKVSQCPWNLKSMIATLRLTFHWTGQLSYPCTYIQNDSHPHVLYSHWNP